MLICFLKSHSPQPRTHNRTVTVVLIPELWLVLVWLIAIMREVLVLISFDTLKFITPIKVRGNHKIVSNIWNPSWEIKLLTGHTTQEGTVTIIGRLTTLTHLQWKTFLTKGKNVQYYYSPQSDMKSNRSDLSMIVDTTDPKWELLKIIIATHKVDNLSKQINIK